jgi:hypothetical protein
VISVQNSVSFYITYSTESVSSPHPLPLSTLERGEMELSDFPLHLGEGLRVRREARFEDASY